MRDEDYFNQRKQAQKKQEQEWKQGSHTDGNGKKWGIAKMTDEHLQNTIDHFARQHYDVGRLKSEQRMRKNATLKKSVQLLKRAERSTKTSTAKRKKARKARKSLSRYLKT